MSPVVRQRLPPTSDPHFQAGNGPLQARTKVLQADLNVARQFPADYQTDLESDFARLSEKRSFCFSSPLIIALDPLGDGEDLDRTRNLFYQSQVSSRLSKQMNDVVNLLTRALNIHLNVEQEFTLNTSNVVMSLATLKGESLRGKEIQSVGNARLRLPSQGNLSLDEHQSGSLRVRSFCFLIFLLSFLLFQSTLEPLASFGTSSSLNTNLSRTISFTWMNEEENEIPLRTDLDHPFEIVIPRDPSLIIPSMSLVNVTGERGFHFHSIGLNQLSPSVSIHWEFHPLNINLSYAFIYRFDQAPTLNTSRPQIDGWAVFSSSSNTHLSLSL